MGKIKLDEFSKRRPKVTVDDLDEGADAMALVIASAEESQYEDEDGKRKSMVITFEESGEKVYYPNVTSLRIIVGEYGDDSDEWVGKPLPLMRHSGSFRGEAYENLQVPTADLWLEIIKGSGLTPAKSSRPAVKVAAKKAPARRGKR